MSAIVRRPPPRVTLEDFLAWPGDGTAKRHQLVDGEIRAMAPASDIHGTIQSRVGYLISRHLDATASKCRGVTEGAIVPHVRRDANLRVADYVVTCAPTQPGGVVVPEPILVVEVLSPGNESDTRENVWTYTTIASVREILVLHSTRVEAEVLRRAPDGAWPENPETIGSRDTLKLDSIGLACALAEVYARTHLA